MLPMGKKIVGVFHLYRIIMQGIKIEINGTFQCSCYGRDILLAFGFTKVISEIHFYESQNVAKTHNVLKYVIIII